jgi:hypothetical protein
MKFRFRHERRPLKPIHTPGLRRLRQSLHLFYSALPILQSRFAAVLGVLDEYQDTQAHFTVWLAQSIVICRG